MSETRGWEGGEKGRKGRDEASSQLMHILTAIKAAIPGLAGSVRNLSRPQDVCAIDLFWCVNE